MRKRLVFAAVGLGVVALAASLVSPDIPVEALKSRYAGPTSRFMDVDGLSVHYRMEGVGPPLVLLHGGSSSLHTWEGWTQALSGRFRVIRLDLPGYGLTGPRADRRYAADDSAQLLAAFLDRVGVKRASFAGNSLGGHVAWRFAVLHPERVDKLILVDAAGFPLTAPPLPFRLARVPVLKEVLRVVSPRPLVQRSVREVYGDPSLVTPALVDRYYDLTLRTGNRGAFIDRANAPWVDQTAELGKVTAPTLILWGGKDAWLSPESAQKFADAIRGARVVRYPELGHIPMEEDPARTAVDAKAFLLERATP